MKQRLIVIGGGIGTGKSTVRRALAERGVHVIDADSVGHEVLAPGGAAVAAVSERWPDVVGDDGVVDRRALGRMVFTDPEQLAELEAITHPTIRERIGQRIAEHGDEPVAVEFPFVVHPFGDDALHVIVDVEDEIRTNRLLARGMDAHEIRQRIEAQPPRGDWLAAADVVIDNSGDEQDLDGPIDELVRHILDA